MVTVIVAAVQVLLQIFGINIGRDGVNINWRRLLLWGLISPVLALVAGRVVSVFSDILVMFRQWSGEDVSFSLGLNPSFAPQWLISTDGTHTGVMNFILVLVYWFGIDRIIVLSVQILSVKIFMKNSERICSAITAAINTAVACCSK